MKSREQYLLIGEKDIIGITVKSLKGMKLTITDIWLRDMLQHLIEISESPSHIASAETVIKSIEKPEDTIEILNIKET